MTPDAGFDRIRVESFASDCGGLLELVRAIVWRADARTFQTSFVSKGSEAILGYPAEAWAEVPGFWVQHIHPDDRDWVLEFSGQATREHRTHDFEYRMVVGGGRTVWLRNIVNVVVENGEATEIVGVTVDITARKQAEVEAASLRYQLSQALRVSSLGELAAMLAHELNQPLGALASNAEAAQLSLAASQYDRLPPILADIVQDAHRAGGILHRVRRVLQKEEVELRPLDLPRLIDDIIGMSRALALSRQIQITLDVEPSLPQPRGDPVQIQQVLVNLILNAMDAVSGMPVPLRRVQVGARRTGTGVELQVADTGTGIPADALPRVFEPFFTTKSGGMGMGLPICRTIVESHGGGIRVENNADGGVTVRVTLPADGDEGGRWS